jgi:hypothetical protein
MPGTCGRTTGQIGMQVIRRQEHQRNKNQQKSDPEIGIIVSASARPLTEVGSQALAGECFNYSTLQDEVASNLRLQAVRIKERIGKATQDLIDIGRDLQAARQHLERGQFITWVEAEVGIPARSAQNYMAMARLADDQGETVSLLSPRAVQRLAAKSAPSEVVQEVLARARSGDVLPEGTVSKLISHAKLQKRETERRAALDAKRRKEPKKKREAREERERRWQEEQQQRKLQENEAVETLIEALGVDGVALVVKVFSDTWNFSNLVDALREKISASSHDGRPQA